MIKSRKAHGDRPVENFLAKTTALQTELEHFMAGLRKRNPEEQEFHQAVQEFAASVMPIILMDDAPRRLPSGEPRCYETETWYDPASRCKKVVAPMT